MANLTSAGEQGATNFECCKKDIAKIFVCLHCGDSYHKSCAERSLKNATKIKGNLINCNTNECVNITSNNSDDLIIESLQMEINKLKMENKNLKLENEQQIHKINTLQQQTVNNSCAQQHSIIATEVLKIIEPTIKRLENELQQINFKIRYNRNEQTTQNIIEKNMEIQDKQTTGQDPKKSWNEKLTTNHRILSQAQTLKMDEIINLTESCKKTINLNKSVPNQTNLKNISQNDASKQPIETTGNMTRISNEGFKKVSYKKKKTAYIGVAKVDEAKKETGFIGREQKEKKVWLFISRAKNHVTTDIVKDYLVQKTKEPEDKVEVQELNTRSDKPDNKCFMVGLKWMLKEEAYKTEFWPEGVAVARFNFKQGSHFLEKKKDPE